MITEVLESLTQINEGERNGCFKKAEIGFFKPPLMSSGISKINTETQRKT